MNGLRSIQLIYGVPIREGEIEMHGLSVNLLISDIGYRRTQNHHLL
jgi:hypothetical protein